MLQDTKNMWQKFHTQNDFISGEKTLI